jgi:hypothetical protein
LHGGGAAFGDCQIGKATDVVPRWAAGMMI